MVPVQTRQELMKLSEDQLELLNDKKLKSIINTKWLELSQNNLKTEPQFIRFARECGLPIRGVVSGEPSEFHSLGLLKSDGNLHDTKPTFHPFRLMVLNRLLRSRTQEHCGLLEQASVWNKIVDLAIILEPVFWPSITGLIRFNHFNELSRDKDVLQYKKVAFELLGKLDVDQWKKVHQSIKFDAAKMDDNSELYLLLRLSHWENRSTLKGAIAGSLWLRHIAEVLRLGFEEVHNVRWHQEDYCSGYWGDDARALAYGSVHPLDNQYLAKDNLLRKFGLLSGSRVRWYVEGPTELHAVLAIIPSPAKLNIEVVDLKGNIATEKHNIALKLSDCLSADIELRRFSFITYDKDVSENVRTIKTQVNKGKVCGLVAENNPDFEFANFSLEELIGIAVDLDKSKGHDVTNLMKADWSKVKKGKDFEKVYKHNSETHRSIKGKEWGHALAKFMVANPELHGKTRAFIRQLESAIRAVKVSYELQSKHFQVNPEDLMI